MSAQPPPDVLASREAGARVVRGGALRTGGYVAGMVLVAGASIVLTRYLGVDDFGRFTAVTALVAIATAVADAGLTTIGQREMAAQPPGPRRRAVLGDVVGLRLVLTPLAAALTVLVAVALGFDRTMVAGTAIAGAGGVLYMVGAAYLVWLSVELRLGRVTVVELVHKLVLVVALVALVIAGTALLPFFAASVVAGAGALVAAVVLTPGEARVLPRLAWTEMRRLLREVAPLALALALNQLYLRAVLLLLTVLGTSRELGLFSASFRITEVLVGLPAFMIGAAFPVLAHAGEHDEERLAYGLERLVEIAVLAGGALAVALVVGAEPAIAVVGGDAFADAAPALRIQALAVLGAGLTQVFVLALVAVRGQRVLVVTNLVAMAAVVGGGLLLIPPLGELGAAIVAAAGELLLAAVTFAALRRARPGVRLAGGRALRALAAAGVACLLVLAPLPAAAATALALAVYVALVLVLRAVPGELWALAPARLRRA